MRSVHLLHLYCCDGLIAFLGLFATGAGLADPIAFFGVDKHLEFLLFADLFALSCNSRWRLSPPAVEQHLSHWEQTWLLLLPWQVFSWRALLSLRLQSLEHLEHLNGVFWQWMVAPFSHVFSWRALLSRRVKSLQHLEQLNVYRDKKKKNKILSNVLM